MRTTAAPRVSAAPDLLSWVRAAVSIAFVVLLPLLLIGTSLRSLVSDRDLLLRGFADNRVSVTTGPKTSSHWTLSSASGVAITVGRRSPSSVRSPPVSTLPEDSRIHDRTRSRSDSVISGPTSVSSSAGSPTLSASTLGTNPVTKSSQAFSVT